MCAAESDTESEKTSSELVEQNQLSISPGAANPENNIDISRSLPHPLHDSLPSDPKKSPDIVFNAQRVDIA